MIVFRGYRVEASGTTWPLGHAAVIAVDERGNTRYYEFGRYDGGSGKVRRRRVPNLEMGEDGQPTQASLDRLLNFVSEHYGQGSRVAWEYVGDADYQTVVDFAEQASRPGNNIPWGPQGRSCYTFASDAIDVGRGRSEARDRWLRFEEPGGLRDPQRQQQ
jgi:hypothetical protein